MRRLYFLSLLLFIMLLLGGCKGFYYPASVPVPLLQQQGELQADAGLGFDGLSVRGAYAITDHVGVMTGFTYESTKTKIEDADGEHYISSEFYHLGNLGLGYSGPIGTETPFVWEVYAGTRQGDYHYHEPDSVPYDGWMSQYYIQPSIGIRSRFVDVALTMRLINHRVDNINVNFLEPFVTLKLGYKYVKFYTQMGMSFQMLKKHYNRPPSVDSGSNARLYGLPYMLNLGLQLNLFTQDRPSNW